MTENITSIADALGDAKGYDALDLPADAAQHAASGGSAGDAAEAMPADLHVFGWGTVAVDLMAAMRVFMQAERILEQIRLRAKMFAGDHVALTGEEVKRMLATLSERLPRDEAGRTRGQVLMAATRTPEARWGWSVLIGYLRHRAAEEKGSYEYQEVIDRGASGAQAPEAFRYAMAPPPARELVLTGPNGLLYRLLRERPPARDPEMMVRAAKLIDASRRGWLEEFSRDDWRYLRDQCNVPLDAEGSFFVPGHGDELWRALHLVRVIEARCYAAAHEAKAEGRRGKRASV